MLEAESQITMMDLISYLDYLDPFFWIGWIVAIGLCGWLYLMVRRGRLVPFEHPFCSACGFNLHGLPTTSTNCPECGGELQRVRKTEIWKRRWRALLVTFVLAIACLLPVIGFVYRQIHDLNNVPTFALMWFRQKPAVMDLLSRRMLSGELSKSQEESLAEVLISKPGFSLYNAEDLRQKGHFPDRSWKKALEQEATPYIQSRSTVARGDPLVIRMIFQFVPPDARLQLRHRLSVRIDNQEIITDSSWVETTLNNWWQGTRRFINIPPELQGKLADGLHNVSVTVESEITDSKSAPPLRVNKTTTIASVMDLLPRGQSSVALVQPSTKSTIPARDGLIVFLNGEFPESDNGAIILGDYRTKAYCYRLIARQDGREFPIGELQFDLRERYWRPVSPTPLHLGKCDIIFRNDLESAKRTVTMAKIVDDEFVVHDAIVKPDNNPEQK